MVTNKMSMDPSFCRKTAPQRQRARIAENHSWVALQPLSLAKAGCAEGLASKEEMT